MKLDLQASAADRWMKCTRSPVWLAQNAHRLPQDNSTKYSREGTEAHEFAALALLTGYDPEMFPNKDMAKHLKGYCDMVAGWLEIPGATLMVETRVPLFYMPGRNGVIDACVVTDDNRVFIGDLKYGQGVSVAAKNNYQMAIYALSQMVQLLQSGLYEFNDKTLVTMVIYQPRVRDEKTIRLWAVSYAELKEFCMEVEITAQMILEDENWGEFAPSDDTCQFCPGAEGVCEARGAQQLDGPGVGLLQLVRPVEDLLVAPDFLSPDQLARVVKAAPSLITWLNKCTETGAALLNDGKPFPGFKLVEGREGNRKWANEDEAAEMLLLNDLTEEDIYTQPALISPTKAEELLGSKKLITPLVFRSEGKPIMVPEDDPRATFSQNPVDIFDDLTQDTALLG